MSATSLALPGTPAPSLSRGYLLACQPIFCQWSIDHPDRFSELTPDEIDELLSLQATGGPLTEFGVEHFVGILERRRKLHLQLDAIAGTDWLDHVERYLELVFQAIQVRPSVRGDDELTALDRNILASATPDTWQTITRLANLCDHDTDSYFRGRVYRLVQLGHMRRDKSRYQRTTGTPAPG